MRRGFLQSRKVDAVRPPFKQVGAFVEAVSNRSGRATRGRHYSQSRITGEISGIAHRRSKDDLFAVGRPTRIAVWAGLRNQLCDHIIREVEHVNVRSDSLDQIGIYGGTKRDPRSVA